LSDTVQPTADGIVAPDLARPAGQDQEGGLKNVLGVVGIAKHPPGNAKNHASMPLDKNYESLFLPLRQETLKELAVGLIASTFDCARSV